MIIHLEINDGCMYDTIPSIWTFGGRSTSVRSRTKQHTPDWGEVINCAPNQNQWLWIPNHPPSAISLFFDISINWELNPIPITSFTYIRASPTTIRGRNYTKRSSVNDLNAKERNVETSRAYNQPQREDHWADDCVIEDGAALLHKTEDSRGQQRYTTKVCKHKYSQHIEQLQRRLLFLVLSDARTS